MRRLELDALRGLMLVWMTLTHLPTAITTYTYQPFGFVSSAEGFIFLSALFTGLIYFRLARREGYSAMSRRLWTRTLRLYGWHMLLVAGAFVVLARIAGASRPGLHNLLDFYFAAGPKRASFYAALLVYRPPLLDILPLYISFLGLTPVALSVAARIGWRHILTASFTLWLMAQFGLRQIIYDWITPIATMHVPLNEMGAFDLFAWQLVWLLGLWCGVRWAQDDLPIGDWARSLTIPAAVIAVGFLGLRYGLDHGLQLQGFEPAFDKWHVGVARLINFAAIAVLLVRFQPSLKRLAIRPLVLLGQASLQVFCAHLFFVFLGLAMMGDNPILAGWKEIALPVVTFATLLLVAWRVSQGKHNRVVTIPPTLSPAST
ncbi:MAG TPA: OpgC domain-containing protein [Terriglobales bacterium]|nr:OpgC domain-containing protein [Terriglobales bacterium]